MSISTLRGTCWQFNNTVNLPENGTRYNIGFFADGNSDEHVAMLFSNSNKKPALYFVPNGGLSFVAYRYQTYYGYEWNGYKHSYRNVFVTGGVDAENEDVIAWFEENATQVDLVKKLWASTLQETANAIRSKGGTSAQISFSNQGGFASAINAIKLGTDTTDGTAFSKDVISGKIAYARGSKLIGNMPEANGEVF